MAYLQVFSVAMQNRILSEGGEQAIEKLYLAYEKQLNDFTVKIMKEHGQRLTKDRIEECQAAAKLKFCEIIRKKPHLYSDIMCYSQQAIKHAVEYELFGKNPLISGARNSLKVSKIIAARENLSQKGIENPTPEEIFEELQRNPEEEIGVKDEKNEQDRNDTKDYEINGSEGNKKRGNRGKTTKNGKTYPDISLNFIRNVQFKVVPLEGIPEGFAPSSWEKGPEEQVQDTELREIIQKAFSVLGEGDRDLLALQESGMSQKEIAAELGMEPEKYRYRKSVLETYLAAVLIAAGYQDLGAFASHRYEVVIKGNGRRLYPVLVSMREEEQKALMRMLAGKKAGRMGGSLSCKVIAVLECLAMYDERYGGLGVVEIYHRINRQVVQPYFFRSNQKL